MILFSVFWGHPHSIWLLFITAKMCCSGLSCTIKFEAILFTEIRQKDLI